MLNTFPAALAVSTALGFLSGLGVGGGSLLMLWLTVVLGWDPRTARGTNLLFFLPAAIVSTLLRRSRGTLEWKPLVPAILTGCLAAGICTAVSLHAELSLLKKGFSLLLLFTGARELLYRPGSSKKGYT